MTGKSEWRIIHMQNGMLVDSVLTQNKNNQQAQGTGDSSYIAAYAGIDQTATGGQQVRPQDRRRASDSPSAPGGASSGMTGAPPGDGTNPDGSQQAGAQPQPGMPPGMPGMPGTPGMPGGQPVASSQNTGGGYVSALPGIGASYTGQPTQAYPGQPNPNMPGYQNTPNPQQGLPGLPTAPSGAPNPATQMISDMLTRPNPAGYNAIQRAQQQQGMGGSISAPGTGSGIGQPQQQGMGGSPGMTGPGVSGATLGGGAGGTGMAGIASTAKLEGIMVYNDRTAYNEWEFIFDPSKVPPIPPMPGGSAGGTPANRVGTPVGQMNGGASGAFPMGGAGGAQGAGGMMGGRMGGGLSAGGMAGGPAGMQMGQMGQGNSTAGMQMGGMGMTNTGLPGNIRLGRP